MSRLDTSLAEPPRHVCEPPAILTWSTDHRPTIGEPPRLLARLRPGTRFHCDCGTVWVVVHVPEQVGSSTVVCARDEWHPETRRQARQRRRAEKKEARRGR